MFEQRARQGQGNEVLRLPLRSPTVATIAC